MRRCEYVSHGVEIWKSLCCRSPLHVLVVHTLRLWVTAHPWYDRGMKEHAKKCKSIDGSHRECDCDGFHTFDELYEHRITLYIALCKSVSQWRTDGDKTEITMKLPVWRSWRHSDGEICFGTGTQFVLGIGKVYGKQITYHIPSHRWEEANFAEILDKAPEWDKHSSDDVLERIKNL